MPPLAVAVNLSPRTLLDPGLPRRVAQMLAVFSVPPESVAFEITENILMSDPARSMASLNCLNEMGVRIVLDDFGTGYSSLSYLRRLPIHELKIDRSFVATLVSGADDVIVRSAVDLAHNLGLRVVAEGVETLEVWERLEELGCDGAQGTFICPPGPAATVRAWKTEPHRNPSPARERAEAQKSYRDNPLQGVTGEPPVVYFRSFPSRSRYLYAITVSVSQV